MRTEIITEVIIEEESAAEGATKSILFVIVIVLALIVISLATYCIVKRKRGAGPVRVNLPKDSQQHDTD